MNGYIVYLLELYNEISIKKRGPKRPKIYFSNTGLASYLVRVNSPEMIQSRFFKWNLIPRVFFLI